MSFDNVFGAPPPELAEISEKFTQFSPLSPGADRLEARQGLDNLVMLAPPGAIERRAVLALALRALKPGAPLLALAPTGPWGVVVFVANLMLFGLGAVLVFINFIALRQAVTPAPLLGRMTSTMRWLILLPAGPGALIGGWLDAANK